MNRRQFIAGLLASVATPVVKLPYDDKIAVFGIDYVPSSIKELDILYGFKYIKPEWLGEPQLLKNVLQDLGVEDGSERKNGMV